MVKNVGSTDRMIRIVAGLMVILGAFFTNYWLVAIIGVVLIGTAVLNMCPIYMLLGVSTCPVEPK